MCGLSVVIFLLSLLFLVGYFYSKVKFRRFQLSGVKFLEPQVFFGNMMNSIFGREHLTVTMKSLYDLYPDDKYVAIFELLNPTIVLKDPEIIKQVTIKSFDHFHDVPFQVSEDVDPVFGNVLLSMKGKKWRQMRSTLSPAFTSSKMRNMFQFTNECGMKVIDYYQDQCSTSGKLRIDIRDVSTRFTNDVIASIVFSFDVDSLKERDNAFYKSASSLFEKKLMMVVKFLGFRIMPSVMKMFGIKLFPDKIVNYLRNMVLDTIKQRESNHIYRSDMLQLLIEAKKGTLKHDGSKESQQEFASAEENISESEFKSSYKWTDSDLAAQAIVFILAGYGTTSTVINFLMYELALNQDVQKRLQDDIDVVLKECDGKITYNVVLNMKYLDMVVSEVLRKWPPIPLISRLCTETYNLGPIRNDDGTSYTIQNGENVWVPVHSIHMDSNFWKNPEQFDPERFNDENKKFIKPQTYLPFGSGPRNCIGSRFALMQIKVIVLYFLANFSFEPCPKTAIPINLSTDTLFLDSKDDFWLDMISRKHKVQSSAK